MGLIENAVARTKTPIKNRRSGASTKNVRIGEATSPVLSHVQTIEPSAAHLFDERLICGNQSRAAINAYKMMRTHTLQRLKANNWSSMAVTAARAGEGKTTTAINLAITLANRPDQTVFLVDLDLRNPAVGRYLGLPGPGNLIDVLDGTTSLHSGLVKFGDEPLFILHNEIRLEDSSEKIAAPEMDRLVRELSQLGGIVIYDLPPLLVTDDYLALSNRVDCSLFVVSEGQTLRSDIPQIQGLMDPSTVIGVVLNKSRESTDMSYYY